jgi:hypothetical protein
MTCSLPHLGVVRAVSKRPDPQRLFTPDKMDRKGSRNSPDHSTTNIRACNISPMRPVLLRGVHDIAFVFNMTRTLVLDAYSFLAHTGESNEAVYAV